ncbi:MAG: VOC family protein [Fuerstiella sp.]|nr:VOC family protein [Fuerstiella sp.]
MSEFNSKHNRAVWFDIPVIDLDRSVAFYAAVLGVGVSKGKFDDVEFAVIDHSEGNGGCLVPHSEVAVSDNGILLYLNANGRIHDAVAKTETHGGSIVEPIHSIGPHGFRAIIRDSEGNRLALHSESDV